MGLIIFHLQIFFQSLAGHGSKRNLFLAHVPTFFSQFQTVPAFFKERLKILERTGKNRNIFTKWVSCIPVFITAKGPSLTWLIEINDLKTLKGLALQDILTEAHLFLHRSKILTL